MKPKYDLYDSNKHKIKGTSFIGTLVDVRYSKIEKSYIYILEENEMNDDDDYPLHDVLEENVEEIE